MTSADARSRVARGAAHLDTVRPGWAGRIDTGTLTLHDPCGCIVGQLCRTGFLFLRGLVELGVDEFSPDTLGFEIDDESADWHDLTSKIKAYQPLQDAWLEAIADRLVPVSVLVPVAVAARG